MIFLLLSLFIGQDSAALDVKQTVAAWVEVCKAEARRELNYRASYLNARIELLSKVRKAKASPAFSTEVNWRWDFETKEAKFYTIQFSSPKAKADYEKQLRTEILEGKQELAAARPAKLPTIHAEFAEDFGVPNGERVRVVLVIDENTLLIQFSPHVYSKDYILTGLPTEGMTDDSLIKLDAPIVRNGTAKRGFSNFAAYRVITAEEAKELGEQVRAIDHGEKIRAWESADRQHTTRAKLVGFDLRTVKLQREDGEVVELPLAKLSKEDQTHVQRALGLEPVDVP